MITHSKTMRAGRISMLKHNKPRVRQARYGDHLCRTATGHDGGLCMVCGRTLHPSPATEAQKRLLVDVSRIKSIEWAGPLKAGPRVLLSPGDKAIVPVQTCPECHRERGTGHAEWCWIGESLRSAR